MINIYPTDVFHLAISTREPDLNYTIFDTPVIRTITRWASLIILNFSGWKTKGKLPDDPKFVLIAAPHTSNWDLPFMLFIAFALRAKIYWMGKDAIFRRPFGPFFRWLGGIPIDRSKKNNVVAQSLEQFHLNQTLILAVPPAGTRKRVMYWKTGFYHIAHGAKVPVVCAFLDYRKKIGGIGPVIRPTGNIEADMIKIRYFYKDISGKYPLKSIASAGIKAKIAG